MSFSSAELYVRTIIPWFVVLLVVVFLILIIALFFGLTLFAQDGNEIASSRFSVLNWVVVIVFLLGTTLIGELAGMSKPAHADSSSPTQRQPTGVQHPLLL